MSSLPSERDPFEQLAEAFLTRYRAGERPSVSEYARQHPELAEKIRELLPALVMMEELRPVRGGPAALGTGKVSEDGKIPQQLGEYRILREVGRGGMGVVYEAVQESLGRHVALKVLPFNSLISPTHLERFRREARAAARLHHTNIVPVFGVGEHEGIHYYAMQFIQGQGLDLVLREVRRLRSRKEKGTMPDPQSGEALASSVAEGLLSGAFSFPLPDSGAAFLVHKGDLRNEGPGADFTNLQSVPLLTRPASAPEGRSGRANKQGHTTHTTGQSELTGSSEAQYFRSVARVGVQVAEALEYAHRQGVLHRDIKPSNLLLDTAGTVWVTDFGLAKEHDSEELTSPGDVVGTLRYMAPERFEGRSDPRSDVYGLGMTLYELLTLRPALDDSHRARLIERIKQENPPLPSKIDRRIPRDLETIVLKATAKEPGQRYPTADALAEDLRRALADRPIRARRTPLLERAWRLCRRNPALSVLTVSVALLLLIVAIGSTTAALWLNRSARQQTEKLCQALLAQARNGRLSRRVGQRFESLKAVEEAVKLARELSLPQEQFLKIRNEAIACMALPDLRVAREWEGNPGGTVIAHCDGLMERYARLDDHGTVSIRRIADDQEIYCLTNQDEATGLAISPDGRFLVLAFGPVYKLWKLAGPEPSIILEDPDCTSHDFSPGCRQVALGRRNGSVDLYDLASGQQVRRMSIGAEPRHLAFHPTQPQLAIALPNEVRIWDVEGNKLVELPVAECSQATWHPDGKVLAAVGEGNIIYIWDVVSRKQTAKLEGCRNAGVRIAFNHAGDLLASAGWEGILRLWDPRTGKQLFHTPAAMWDLHFSRDDRFLAAEMFGSKLRIWEIDAGREYRTPARIPVHREIGTRSTVSPDGRLLAVGTVNAGFGLWNLASGKELLFHPMPGVTHVVFEPSGALLAQGWNRLWRWPVKDEGATVWIGPPQPVPLPGSLCGVACSGDARVIASPQFWGSLVWQANHPERPVILAPHSDVRSVDVSPDGRWVATASHGASSEVKVWESETGKLAKALSMGGGHHAATFSPDGRWLAARGDYDIWVWEAGSWQSQWHVEEKTVHGLAFSPDSKMFAFGTRDGVVRLVYAETGREWARLIDPDQERPDALTFTPDGTQLLVWTMDGSAVHAWDLRAIRKKLAAMGLDWDLPPYPEEQPSSSNLPVREVKLDLGNNIELFPGDDDVLIGLNSFLLALNPFDGEAYWRRGRLYGLRGEAAKAIADYTMALALFPPADSRRAELLFRRANNYLRLQDNARALADLGQVVKLDLGEFCGLHGALAGVCDDMARRLVAGPEKERNPSRALPLAEKAAALTPELSLYRNTLALVYYRLGKYRQAIKLLERAQSNAARPAFDLFILAMSHAQFGEGARALEYYHLAVTWLHEHQGRLPIAQRTVLEALNAEAEAALAQPTRF